jgi:thioredoxin-related protein
MRPAIELLARIALAFALLAQSTGFTRAAETFDPSPHAIDIPPWFKTSFLDLGEDVAEAARDGRRLMVYFGQDGCPYCRELMRVNFSQKALVDQTLRHFHAVALNIWGDREVTWTDGRRYSEKAFAALLKVQFTPTLVFFDEKGRVALRINGYYPPHRLAAALDYVAGHHETRGPFAPYLAKHGSEPSSGRLHEQPFFMKPPYDLSRARKAAAKPFAVFFEQKDCAACDELHAKGLSDRRVRSLLPKFHVVRLELFGRSPVVTPAGRRSTESEWARELNVAYTPGVVFLNPAGEEVFRLDGYLRPFHLASSFDYVASGAYRAEPSFQRYLQARAAKIRESGGKVELW